MIAALTKYLSILTVGLSFHARAWQEHTKPDERIVLRFDKIQLDGRSPQDSLTSILNLRKFYDSLGQSMRIKECRLWDLDTDGVEELVLIEYTGGAHCCDRLTLFRAASSDTFQSVAAFTAQSVILDSSGELQVDITPSYFHTCYACAVTMPGPPVRSIARYRYRGPDVVFARRKENDTLALRGLRYLSRQTVPSREEANWDEGWRKAYATCILSYFYTTYDPETTKKLFDEYYHRTDREVLWRELEAMMILDRPVLR